MRRALGVVLLAGVLSCGEVQSGSGERLNQRQRDSAIGESRLPGAQGVRGALRASDSAAARRAREDTTAQ